MTLELILTPFRKGKRSGQSFVIQLLKCVFSASLSNKKSLSEIRRTSTFIVPSLAGTGNKKVFGLSNIVILTVTLSRGSIP